MIFAILIQHQIKIKIDLFESLMIKIKSDVSPILGFGFGFGYKIFWVLGIGFGYWVWVLGLGIYTQPKAKKFWV